MIMMFDNDFGSQIVGVQQLMIMMFVWFLDSRSSTAYDNDVCLVLRQQQFNSL